MKLFLNLTRALCSFIQFYLNKAYPMRGHNSSFLLTEQSKYQQQLFDKSINRVRKRINILSTSAIYSGGTEGTFQRQQVNTSQIRREKLPGSGLCAAIAKLAFDAEMVQQDIRGEMLQLRKSRQFVAILAQDLRRRTHKAQQQMRFQMQQLRREADAQRERNIERSRKLAMQCQERRRGSEKLREKIQQAARRVKALQSSLGCYTAVEKLNSV